MPAHRDDREHRPVVGRRRLTTEPFPPLVRRLLLAAGVAVLATGVVAVFRSGNDTGSAALVTTGAVLGVVAAIGPFVRSVKVGGVELWIPQVEDALRDAERGRKVHVGPEERSSALGRAEAHAELLEGAMVLWVDDQPGGNDAERRVLTSLGMSVDIAVDNDEARDKARSRQYACVISDIKRKAPPGARRPEQGTALAGPSPVHPRLIYYVRNPRYPAPPGSMGITNRPNELLHLVVDAVELDRFPRAGAPSLAASRGDAGPEAASPRP